jgi:hypothetical protein
VSEVKRATLYLVGLFLALAVFGVCIAACGEEATKDATKSGQTVDRGPAEVIAMPDKFRNVATKCDGHGHRVYSSSTGSSGNSAQVFVIDDAGCPGGKR